MNIAVITGASSGMGREFVRAVDQAYTPDEIWVIARRTERLAALQEHCRARIRPLALDLTQEASLQHYAQLLQEQQPTVDVLVNASGFGIFGYVADLPLEQQRQMLHLNAEALTAMTYLTLPYMQRGGKIFQLGSMSAWQPTPYMTVYAATKAYVVSFSRALNRELKPRGIRVMAVCPGFVTTEFLDIAVKDDTVRHFNRYHRAEDVIRRALRDMERGRDVSIQSVAERWQARLVKLLPAKLVMAIWCRQQGK